MQITKVIPQAGVTAEEKRKAQSGRSSKYKIKVQPGARLIAPPTFPQDEKDYGDPVNLAYPLIPLPRLRNAMARFGQFAEEAYAQDKPGMTVVADRIVTRALESGIVPDENSVVASSVSGPVAAKLKQAKQKMEKTEKSTMARIVEGLSDSLCLLADEQMEKLLGKG